MSRKSKSIVTLLSGLMVAAPLCVLHAADQPASPATPVVNHHRAHKKQAQLVLPPLPGGPLKQVPMEQLPPSAPRVTFENGMLAIAAQNSTLGEILRDVRKLTGATIDIPPGGGNERVVTSLGPAAPRDVLATLLNGTPFNYVMLGTTSDPNSVATVVLSAKPAGAGDVQTAANVYQPPQPATANLPPQPFRNGVGTPFVPGQARPGEVNAAGVAADDSSDDADADDKDDDSDQAQPGAQPGPAQPDSNNPAAGAQPDQSATDPNQPNAGPRTPEQMLEMMRRGQPIVPPGATPPQQ